MAAARAAGEGQDQDTFLELKYEQLLSDPAPNLARAAAFCGLEAGQTKIDTLVSAVRPDRGLAFASDDEAVAFTRSVGDRLQAHGYRQHASK